MEENLITLEIFGLKSITYHLLMDLQYLQEVKRKHLHQLLLEQVEKLT